jgi:hypothetical protein
MPVQGRPKGNKAEIEIAKMFSAWWSAFEPGDFVRTPLSGGWGGKDLRAGFKASGDIMTTAQQFPFTIEVKRREGWSWKTLVAGKKSPVWGYWRQALSQAKEMGGIPLLFFRRNREPWNVMLPFREAIQSTQFRSEDYRGIWLSSELADSGVDFGEELPVIVPMFRFFQSKPHIWTLMAPTFPKP